MTKSARRRGWKSVGPYFAMRLPWPEGPFRGFGRAQTRHDGSFTIVTRKPGPLPFGDGRTDETQANETDPVPASIPEARRSTLIAVPFDDGLLRFDIHLQGEDETVFFDL